MKYAICNTQLSIAAGFKKRGHRMKDDEILLNEREILINSHLEGTLEERVAQLEGTLYTEVKAIYYLNQNKWT